MDTKNLINRNHTVAHAEANKLASSGVGESSPAKRKKTNK